MRRPRSIILLIVWFLWATGKDLDGLARFGTTADYYIFASIGSAWAYFALAGESAAVCRGGESWPADDSRIDVIGANGPTGEHYEHK